LADSIGNLQTRQIGQQLISAELSRMTDHRRGELRSPEG
jgi:hypothetical protein